MDITNIWLDESINECVGCGACNSLAPLVFAVNKFERIDVDTSWMFAYNNSTLQDAVDCCPYDVIRVERGYHPAFDNRNILIGRNIRVDKMENIPDVRLAVLDETDLIVVGLTPAQWESFRDCGHGIEKTNAFLESIGTNTATPEDVVLVIGAFDPPRVACAYSKRDIGIVRLKTPYGWRVIVAPNDKVDITNICK